MEKKLFVSKIHGTIQQMLLQVLQAIFDPTFSAHSFGFRPGKSAHDAVRAAQKRIDKAASKGRIHKNQAARRTSRLMKKAGTTAS